VSLQLEVALEKIKVDEIIWPDNKIRVYFYLLILTKMNKIMNRKNKVTVLVLTKRLNKATTFILIKSHNYG